MSDNLYRIDDVLIRAGIVLGIVAGIAIFNLPDATATGPLAWLWLFLPLLLAAPVVMLIAGLIVRQRESRLVEIWRILKEHGEMPVTDLRQMSGYSRKQLRAAVGLLNRKIAAGLSWDEASDTIRHVRLGPRQTLTHSQRCASCGASVSVDVSARSQADGLTCPYCRGSLDSRTISKLQSKLLTREAQSRNPEPSPFYRSTPSETTGPPQKRFSLVLFCVLLVFFWPGALAYAIHRANRSRSFY